MIYFVILCLVALCGALIVLAVEEHHETEHSAELRRVSHDTRRLTREILALRGSGIHREGE